MDNGQFATLGECTGSPDKNGKSIFEGDIIEYRGVRYKIEYLKDYVRFSAVRPNSVFSVFNLARSEILGNIYDNPELLERASGEDSGNAAQERIHCKDCDYLNMDTGTPYCCHPKTSTNGLGDWCYRAVRRSNE